jgi:anaerobic magnesium-protoporphyrin IX monomethyl ester cyclase
LREKYPRVPIVWGGYFASLYTEASLNAGYVDFVVKGQGEDTLIELIDELRGSRDFSHVRGLSFKDQFGLHVHTAARALKAPDDFPWLPYHRMDPAKYIAPTFPGSRTAVHQASIGCPFRCNFCGVVPVYDREKMESPARTAAILGHMQAKYGVNAVQSYDNNFFLREDHARTGRTHRAAGSPLVVRSPRRYRAGLLRRYPAQAPRRRLRDDFLRRGIGQR